MSIETLEKVILWPVKKWDEATKAFDHWIWRVPPFNVVMLFFIILTIIPMFLLGMAHIYVSDIRRKRESARQWNLSERLAMMPPEFYHDSDEPERSM